MQIVYRWVCVCRGHRFTVIAADIVSARSNVSARLWVKCGLSVPMLSIVAIRKNLINLPER